MADTTIIPAAEENWRCDIERLNQLRGSLKPWLRSPETEVESVPANTVMIHSIGKDKAAMIRTVRDVAKLPLMVAKKVVEGHFPRRLSVPDVDSATRALEASGAIIERPASENWKTFLLDRVLFDRVPGVELSQDYSFWAHVHSSRHGARGSISALHRQARMNENFVPNARHPRFHFGEYLVGDESLESYLNTSILLRQLEEVGAEWHGVDWNAHDLVDTPPQETWEPEMYWREVLRLTGAAEAESFSQADLSPRVLKWADGRVAVNFCSLNPVGRRRIVLHTDCYHRSYMPSTTAHSIALGSLGYVH